MDRDRIRRSALSTDGTNYRRRLIAYSVTVALILGLLIYQAVRAPDATTPALNTDPPEQPRGSRPSLARVEAERLASVRDALPVERALLEPDAAGHLVEQAGRLVYGDLDAMGLQATARAELLADPEAQRGAPVTVLGHLLTLESVDDSLGRTWRGALADAREEVWTLIVLHEPTDIAPGDVVRISGFFLKHYDALAPDRSVHSGPLVIGQELLRSAWRLETPTEPPASLARVRDATLADASRSLESPEFYELLAWVSDAPEEQLFDPQGLPQEVRPSDLLQNSQIWRGRPVRVSGLLLAKEQVPLGPRGENPLGRPFIWNLWLSAYGGVSRVLVFEIPDDLVPRRDTVDVDGLYFRRYAYENTRDQPRSAAVVVARRVQLYVPEPNVMLPLLIRVSIVIVALLGVLLFLSGRKDRRTAAVARQQRVARQKKLTALPERLSREPRAADGSDPAALHSAATRPVTPGDATPGGPA